MNLGWKELKHNKTKYLLIETILILMIFMVIFLSGLANGLARAVSASIANKDAQYYVLNSDADKVINMSNIPKDIINKVEDQTGDEATPLNIKRTNIKKDGEEGKVDITYFAVNEAEFLAPKITEGESFKDLNTIVLNSSFKASNIAVGDKVVDSMSGVELTVVGFTKDEMYGHSPVGFISTDTFVEMNKTVNPSYSQSYNAIAINGSDTENINIDNMSVVDKATVIKNIPGYSAEQTTINMILWVLVVIAAAVLGIFFYVLTIQKLKQFGVLKAIGVGMNKLFGIITSQVLLLAIFGVVIGNIIAFGMAAMLPKSMPFYLNTSMVLMVSIAFIVISLLTSLISIVKVAKVDPIVIIGGNE